MSATLIHDTELNILMLRVNKMNLSYKLSDRLTSITAITDCDEGFITMETNYGEEYADFIELLETTPFDEKFIEKCTKAIEIIKLEDIKLRRM